MKITDAPLRCCKVEFLDDVPEVVKREILTLWPSLEPLLPSWCRELVFRWKPQPQDNGSCEVFPNFTYKFATIYVTGLWLDDDKEMMRRELVHEIVHLYVEPIAAFAKDTFDILLRDEYPKFHQTVVKELVHRVEQSAQELSWALSTAMKG